MVVSQEATAESVLWDQDINFYNAILLILPAYIVFCILLTLPQNFSMENTYLWLVSEGNYRWQSVFWRISGSGEQALWSRLGHVLDLGQDGTGTGGTARIL